MCSIVVVIAMYIQRSNKKIMCVIMEESGIMWITFSLTHTKKKIFTAKNKDLTRLYRFCTPLLSDSPLNS
jgi:hypothetical protein